MQRHLELIPQDEGLAAMKRQGGGPTSWSSAGMMGLALFIFVYEALAYNIIFLGRVLPAVGKDAIVIPLALVFNAIWLLGMWSYVRAHLSDPGVVPERWYDFVQGMGLALEVVPARAEWQPAKATFCKKCLVPRPERAHHCLSCGICVLRMDHHCPWINNCVGFYNHKFFLLLGAYTLLASLVALASCLPELASCTIALMDPQAGFAWLPDALEATDVIVFVLFGIVTAMVFGLLVQMMVVHVGLAIRNSTSIEDQYMNMSNPFDQGSIVANLSQIFGAFSPDWFIPVRPAQPLSDGIAFPCPEEERLAQSAAAAVGPAGLESPLEREDTEARQLWQIRYKVQPPPSPSADESAAAWDAAPFFTQLFGCVGGGSGARMLPLVDACPR